MQQTSFQRVGTKFLAERKAALLADEMRLGKTNQAIMAAEQLGATKILVICPATVKIGWMRQWQEWSKRDLKFQICYGRKFKIDPEANVVIVNYDILIGYDAWKEIMKHKWAVGIFDESHYLKSRGSKRTKRVLLRGAIASQCYYKWFLTGTPILNRPVELFPILLACAPQVIKPYLTFSSYAKHFCGGYWDGFQYNAQGATHKEELKTRLISSGFMLRRTFHEVYKDMPAPKCELIALQEHGPKIDKLVQKEMNWSKEEASYQKTSSGDELAIIRHELALAKVPFSVQHIKYLLTTNKKVVVFAYHRDVLEMLNKLLHSYNPVVIHGGITGNKRQQRIDKFQQDPSCRVFVGQYKASGVGIDLSASNSICFVESSWVPGDIDQAMARCTNIMKTENVSVHFLVIKGTVEEHMLRTVIDKRKNIQAIIEDDEEISSLFL